MKIDKLEEQCKKLKGKDKIIKDRIADLDEAQLKLTEAENRQGYLLRKMNKKKFIYCRKQSQKLTYLKKQTSISERN